MAAKYLNSTEYGWANYLLGYALTISTLTYFGVQFYLPKELQVSHDYEKTLSSSFWTSSIIFLFIVPVIFVVLRYFVSEAESIYIILLAYLTLVSEIMAAHYIGIGKAGFGTFLRRFLFSIINILLFVLLIFFWQRTGIVYIVSIIITHLFINLPLLPRLSRPSRIKLDVIIRSLRFYLIQIVYGLYAGLSRVFQGIFGSIESVAILSIGLLLSNIAIMMGDNFAKVVMPQFSKAWVEGDQQKIYEIYSEANRFNAYLILPVVIFGMVNAERILGFIGPEYKNGVIVLNLLLFSQFFGTLVGQNGPILSMTDHESVEIFNGILKLSLALALTFLLGQRYLWGIVYSIVASDVLIHCLKVIQVRKIFGFWPYKLKVGVFLIILTITQVAVFLALGTIFNFIVFVLSNGLFFFIVYFISFYFSPEQKDKDRFMKILERLGMRKPPTEPKT